MVQLPKIGTIVAMNPDGTCQQGPIPGLGGPYNTATEYFKAWAAQAKFSMSNDQLRAASGEYADEIVPSVSSFPESVGRLASRLSVRDDGPFPLCHGDFGHNNTVVDDDYQILGVIDWESAFAGPWEIFGDFPLSFSTGGLLRMFPGITTRTARPKTPNWLRNSPTRESTWQL